MKEVSSGNNYNELVVKGKNEIYQFLHENYDVSRETFNKLERYVDLLIERNQELNLIGKNTIQNVWERHILDAIQLKGVITTPTAGLLDIGSGAGIPGVVLSIIGCPDVTVVESRAKKARFLEEASSLSESKIEVINNRIENVEPRADIVVTARAVASLDKLFSLCFEHISAASQTIFFKGAKYKSEIEEAKKQWSFAYKVTASITSSDSVLIEIMDLKRWK